MPFTCTPGQVQDGGKVLFQTVYNSKESCASACSATDGCVAFDYTTEEQGNASIPNACRGVSSGQTPRLGQPGVHNREYCTPEVCERCPVGTCVFSSHHANVCGWFPRAIYPGYHCKVDSCNDVPSGSEMSPCWTLAGKNYYTTMDRSAPCPEATTPAPTPQPLPVSTPAPTKAPSAACCLANKKYNE